MRNGENNIPALILMREETTHKASQVCRQLQGQVRDKCNEEQNKHNKGVRGGMKALLDMLVWEGLSEEVTVEQRPGYRRKQSRIMPRRITGNREGSHGITHKFGLSALRFSFYSPNSLLFIQRTGTPLEGLSFVPHTNPFNIVHLSREVSSQHRFSKHYCASPFDFFKVFPNLPKCYAKPVNKSALTLIMIF